MKSPSVCLTSLSLLRISESPPVSPASVDRSHLEVSYAEVPKSTTFAPQTPLWSPHLSLHCLGSSSPSPRQVPGSCDCIPYQSVSGLSLSSSFASSSMRVGSAVPQYPQYWCWVFLVGNYPTSHYLLPASQLFLYSTEYGAFLLQRTFWIR